MMRMIANEELAFWWVKLSMEGPWDLTSGANGVFGLLFLLVGGTFRRLSQFKRNHQDQWSTGCLASLFLHRSHHILYCNKLIVNTIRLLERCAAL
jgi:hypothetical protein